MLSELFQSLPPEVLKRIGDFDVNIPSKAGEKAVCELLERTVLSGGKRLRPMLTYLMGTLFGASLDRLDVLARSIEQVHAASLAHDDVIDNATLRRGEPSINIQGSNKKAVLAGDFLLSEVIVNLSEQTSLELVREMSLVIKDLSLGEWVQSDAAENREYSPEILEDIAQKKTASVMSWCCLAPAILMGADQAKVKLARDFGHHLGLAFQQMDDTLDFSTESNKDLGLDLQNGLVNFVMYEWLQEDPARMKQYLAGEKLSELVANADFTQACAKVEKRAQDHLQQCRELFKTLGQELPGVEAQKPLLLMIDFLGARSF